METNAGGVGVVGTDRIVGLREAFCKQSLCGGQETQLCVGRVIAKQCTAEKGANAESLECYVPAAATSRFSARTNKAETPTTASVSQKESVEREVLGHDFSQGDHREQNAAEKSCKCIIVSL